MLENENIDEELMSIYFLYFSSETILTFCEHVKTISRELLIPVCEHKLKQKKVFNSQLVAKSSFVICI